MKGNCLTHLLLAGMVFFLRSVSTSPGAALDNWHVRYSGPGSFSDVVYANGLFVATRLFDPVMTSTDGVTWTERPSGAARLARGAAYGAGRFVMVAAGGTNLTSIDGINWTPTPSGTPNDLWEVAFGNNIFVAVGDNAILSSPDGLAWTLRSAMRGTKVEFGNGTFYVLGSYETNFVSGDGITWTPVRSPGIDNEYTVGFGAGTWVLIDIRQNIWISHDALDWRQRGTVDILRPSEIVHGYGTFVMIGGNSTILTSRNGINWTERRRNNGWPLFAVAAGRNTFVGVGYQTIVQSDPIVEVHARRDRPHELEISGLIGRTCRMECSENPASGWTDLGTVLLETDPQIWTDPEPAAAARRFYRAILLE
jgi:hypothetical protein